MEAPAGVALMATFSSSALLDGRTYVSHPSRENTPQVLHGARVRRSHTSEQQSGSFSSSARVRGADVVSGFRSGLTRGMPQLPPVVPGYVLRAVALDAPTPASVHSLLVKLPPELLNCRCLTILSRPVLPLLL